MKRQTRASNIGFLNHLWMHSPFMLRQAQHGRGDYLGFLVFSVRPELVEGRFVSSASLSQVGLLYVCRRVAVITASLLLLWYTSAQAQQPNSLVLSPEQAVAFALERSLVLKAARFGPEIADLDVRSANTAWTPQFSARAGVSNSHSPPVRTFDSPSGILSRQRSAAASIDQLLPWGSSYSVEWDGVRRSGTDALARFNPQLSTGMRVTFTQHLLRGLRIDEARANWLISVKGQTVSEAELTSAVAATTRSVLQAYWSWVHAREYLAVEQQSLAQAQKFLREDRERAALGKIAAVEVVEVESEVARRSDVIVSATKEVANAQDRVRLLIFAPLDLEQSLALVPPPDLVREDITIGQTDELIARALTLRQDLRILRAVLDIDDITIAQLKDEALPDVSLILSYTGLGIAGRQVRSSPLTGGPVTGSVAPSFGSALDDVVAFRYPGWSVGLSVQVPLGESLAAAEAAKASVKRRQDATTLMSAEQQAVTEIKAVIRGVEANRQRLPLTANAVALAERRLNAEERKFLVGLSTTFLVIQAQRDLTAARERELSSLLDYRLSLADLQAVQTIPVR